jgi:hypothetical protein
MKNKVNEANVIVSKTDYETDQGLTQAVKKNKDNVVPVDDAKMDKIEKNAISSTNDSTNTNVSGSSSTPTVTSSLKEIDAVIEPQDQETIKYLSNVKDPKTNQVSKPFTIDGRNYQMVRGMKPNREVVMAVLCLDDNMIHGIEEFEKNVAIPMRERFRNIKPIEEKQEPNQDKEKFVDHLNLADVNGFKHFFVNANTGDVTAKFKTTEEMLKSGIQLKPDERYLDAKKLKHLRYGNYFKPEMNEADEEGVGGTNVDKLKTDVRKLTKLISNKFSMAISKIDKPIEQVEFLSAMAEIIGVPFNKLTTLISSFKDVAGQQKQATPQQAAQPIAPAVTEHKIINKDSLLESLGVKQTITKVKDIKNGK